ncbi:MAG: FAD-dependent oxidoreductase [Chitinophagia bacterium]|nr:FAD-dependent oxidoreductase [Chitinophagia bacterium]
MKADIIVCGGGLGGFAATLAAARNGYKVILTEETDWIGGQLTQQGVPPDEHPWIETHGAPSSYRAFRNAVREYYKNYYPLTDDAKARSFLNPGDGAVSRLCHEPRVALEVLHAMLKPYIEKDQVMLLVNHKVVDAKATKYQVSEITIKNLLTNNSFKATANYFVDATELGDLLPLTKTDYVTGAESKKQRPSEYDFWRNYIPNLRPAWPGTLLSLSYSNPSTLQPRTLDFNPDGTSVNSVLNLWNYRRIIHHKNFLPGVYGSDISLVNWPMNDYMLGNLVDVGEKEFKQHLDRAKQLSLSLLYWLQTEAKRPDGGSGWPGLRLRNDVMGTKDGLAKYPYIRESRRMKTMFTVKEEHVGKEQFEKLYSKESIDHFHFYDSVGIGYYHIDLHPSSTGDNYIDFDSIPFQIPLGALIPIDKENLLPACKNIGTTHITNGCFRLHPVEWSIGEAVGCLLSYCLTKKISPRKVATNKDALRQFQFFIQKQGLEIEWPKKKT